MAKREPVGIETVQLTLPRDWRCVPRFFFVDLPCAIRSMRAAMRASHCGNKVKHSSQEGAQAHADRLSARPGSRAFDPYRCRYCRAWHVGRRMEGL